jgi:hypothetical protein
LIGERTHVPKNLRWSAAGRKDNEVEIVYELLVAVGVARRVGPHQREGQRNGRGIARDAVGGSR